MLTTTNYQIPYPEPADPADAPTQLAALAQKVDQVLKAAIVPVGAITLWTTATPPNDWLICDGHTELATAFPALALVIPPTAGDITLPDLRDRVPVGASATKTVKSVGGLARVKLSADESGVPAHDHGGKTNVRDRSQNHGHLFYPLINGGGNAPVYGMGAIPSPLLGPANQGGQVVANDAPDHMHYMVSQTPTPAASDHENMPPYLALAYIIRAR